MPRRSERGLGGASSDLDPANELPQDSRRNRGAGSAEVPRTDAKPSGSSAQHRELNAISEAAALLLHSGTAGEGGTVVRQRVDDGDSDDTRMVVNAEVPDVIVSRCSVI